MNRERDGEEGKGANEWPPRQSRRDVMKKGVLASGALGLGVASSGRASARRQQQQQRVLVFLYGYQPNLPFRVTGPLQSSNTVTLLTTIRGNPVPEIDNPSDYYGYIISLFGFGVFTPTFLFTERQLDVGRIYRFTTDFQTFSTQLSLISVPIVPVRQSQLPQGGIGGGNGNTS